MRPEGETLHGGAVRRRLHWARQAEGGPDTLSWYTVAPGESCAPHRHTGKAETWLIVAGHGTVSIASDEFEAVPGDAFVTRPGEAHALFNRGADPLVFVNIVRFTGGDVTTEELE